MCIVFKCVCVHLYIHTLLASSSIAIFCQVPSKMLGPQSDRSWMRRAREEHPAPGAAPKSVRVQRRRVPSRGGSPTSRRSTARGSADPPPPPTRSPPSTVPDYSTVEDVDAADSPWSRATGMPKNEEEEEEMLSFVTRERWLNTCSKHASQSAIEWHPNLSCYNKFQEYELSEVFPHLYQRHGLARSDDVQAQRQASRAAHRVAMSVRASSTVPGPAGSRTCV